MVVIGLDIGKKRIGVAKWTPKGRIVTPLTLIHVKKPIHAFKAIAQLVTEHETTHMVLGYPLMPNGHAGELAALVENWHAKLKTNFDFPIVLWDERMTSKQAERTLSSVGLSQKKQRNVIDMAAAMGILSSWLSAEGHI